MNNLGGQNENNTLSGRLVLAVRIIFFAVLALSLAGLAYYSSIDRVRPIKYNDPVYIEEWTVTGPDGEVFTAGSSYRNEYSEKGLFTMEARMPDYITDGSYLWFIVGGDVYIYINGQLRKDFVSDRDVAVPGGCVKRFYIRTPLSRSDAGAEVKIVRYGTTKGGYVYQDTFVAKDSDFLAYMMSRYGLSLMLEEILLIFAAIIVIISLVMTVRYRRRIEMLYGAMSILVIAGWLITNSFLYPFLYGHYHVDGVMNYMLCLMMPFNLIFYLDGLQKGRYRRIMNVVMCIAALNLIVWPILHFTGIVPFPRALIYIDAFLGLEMLIVAVVMITDMIGGGMKDYKFTAIGFAGFFVCALGGDHSP